MNVSSAKNVAPVRRSETTESGGYSKKTEPSRSPTTRSAQDVSKTTDHLLRALHSPLFGGHPASTAALSVHTGGAAQAEALQESGTPLPGSGSHASWRSGRLGASSVVGNGAGQVTDSFLTGGRGPANERTNLADGQGSLPIGGAAGNPSETGPGSPGTGSAPQPSNGGSLRGGNFLTGTTYAQSSMSDVQRSNGGQDVTQNIFVRNEDGSTYRQTTTHQSDGNGNSVETTEIAHTAADGTVETHTSTTTTNADGSSSTTSTESTTSGASESDDAGDGADSSNGDGADGGDVPEDTGGAQDAGHTVNPGSPIGGLPYGGSSGSVPVGSEPQGKDPRVVNPNPEGETYGSGPIPKKQNGFVNPEGLRLEGEDPRIVNLGDGGWDDPRVINPA